jgi:hypothetical protein
MKNPHIGCQQPSPCSKQDRLGSFGECFRPRGHRHIRLPALLAAQEEDRSDMEGAHHHSGVILHLAASGLQTGRRSRLRHCEEQSDEAIHSFFVRPVDCFASLAMTAHAVIFFQNLLAAPSFAFPILFYMISII